jgi:hypothetical protein
MIVITSRVVEMGKRGGGDENLYLGKKGFLPHITTLSSNME